MIHATRTTFFTRLILLPLLLPLALLSQSVSALTVEQYQTLAAELPPEQLQWVDVNGVKTLALFNRDNTGNTRGGVIIVPGGNGNPVSPELLDPLREYLAKHRWHALAIAMPDTDNNSVRSGENGEKNDEKDGGTGDIEKQAQDTLGAAMAFMQAQGVVSIAIVASDTAAPRAAAFIRSINGGANGQTVRGLALINASNRIANVDLNLVADLDALKMPILDLYTVHRERDRINAKERNDAAGNRPVELYRQTEMPRADGFAEAQQRRLNKRVRGWLDNAVTGTAVKTK